MNSSFKKLNPPIIIATIGPTLEKPEDINRAVKAGVQIFRLPLGYRSRNHIEHIKIIQNIGKETGKDIKTLLDFPSSRPRIGDMPDTKLNIGQEYEIANVEKDDSSRVIPTPGIRSVLDQLKEGSRIFFSDGKLTFIIKQVKTESVIAELVEGKQVLKTNNALFFPDNHVTFNPFVKEDLELLSELNAHRLRPDWIALSFVVSKNYILEGREVIAKYWSDVPIMAKIETSSGVDNIKEITAEAEGLMVARGDLCLSVGPEKLPASQDRILRFGLAAHKFVVVGTQMLENYSQKGWPLRSELIDVATAVRQGASAIMLGKETVWSPRPISTISLAKKIIEEEQKMPINIVQRLKSLGQPYVKNGRVIALEGPHGVGKTTIAKRLAKETGMLYRLGVPKVFMQPELKERMVQQAKWQASALYFIAGVFETERELSAEKVTGCILDRSIWSTLAVHTAEDADRFPVLLKIIDNFVEQLPVPDFLIVLEASYETCRQRIGSERDENHSVIPSREYYKREMEFYRWLCRHTTGNAMINTEGKTQEQIMVESLDIIRKWRE